ncbi:hypothetical protein ACFS2C_28205 [Prauserella oleivorans]|uniref:Uncharacterized protein n=1 Tax=Prauserella oleivorans TaxID=1478153 RepID=A0ABW5WH92_9PSEU
MSTSSTPAPPTGAKVEPVVFSHPARAEAVTGEVAAECARNVHFSSRPTGQAGAW